MRMSKRHRLNMEALRLDTLLLIEALCQNARKQATTMALKQYSALLDHQERTDTHLSRIAARARDEAEG